MAKKKRRLGSLRDDVVRAVKANAERCARAENLKRQIACRSIGLEIAFDIDKSGKVKQELDRGFDLCKKRYDRKGREGELISCVAGMDELTSAFGHRTRYVREKKGWEAAPRGGNGNGA